MTTPQASPRLGELVLSMFGEEVGVCIPSRDPRLDRCHLKARHSPRSKEHTGPDYDWSIESPAKGGVHINP